MNRFEKYYQQYELEDGEKINMVLTNSHIIKLKRIDEGLYHEVCSTVYGGIGSDYDIEKVIRVLYAAYVSAIDPEDKTMDYDAFVDVINPSVAYNIDAYNALTNVSKK